MPNQPNTNPTCPHCGASTRKNTVLKSGNQQYKCMTCNRYHTPKQGKPGRPKKTKPATGQERSAKHLTANREEYNRKQRERRRRNAEKKKKGESENAP